MEAWKSHMLCNDIFGDPSLAMNLMDHNLGPTSGLGIKKIEVLDKHPFFLRQVHLVFGPIF